jgi:hypothetical protein
MECRIRGLAGNKWVEVGQTKRKLSDSNGQTTGEQYFLNKLKIKTTNSAFTDKEDDIRR